MKTNTFLLAFFTLTALQTFAQSKTEKFISDKYHLAMMIGNKYEIPASFLLANAILISDSGTSVYHRKYRNTFKIKCFSAKCKKGHCINGDHKNFYTVFPSESDSWTAFAKLNRRHVQCTPEMEKLIKTYDLTKYDGK